MTLRFNEFYLEALRFLLFNLTGLVFPCFSQLLCCLFCNLFLEVVDVFDTLIIGLWPRLSRWYSCFRKITQAPIESAWDILFGTEHMQLIASVQHLFVRVGVLHDLVKSNIYKPEITVSCGLVGVP